MIKAGIAVSSACTGMELLPRLAEHSMFEWLASKSDCEAGASFASSLVNSAESNR